MNEKITVVAVDAMGGDNAPAEIVKGSVQAVNEKDNLKVILVGIKSAISSELEKYEYDKDKIEIVEASEIIETGEPPVKAIRRKKDSSLVVALNLVKNNQADAFVSAGSSGAVLVGGQLLVGRIKGIERPPLAPLIPTKDGVALLIDCGSNVDARASHLVQFARMGSIYMENVVGIKNPRVALVNIGAEEEKGNALVKETMPLLKNCNDINFIGSIEARDIPEGYADVIVCEAFVGNVIVLADFTDNLVTVEVERRGGITREVNQGKAAFVDFAARDFDILRQPDKLAVRMKIVSPPGVGVKSGIQLLLV